MTDPRDDAAVCAAMLAAASTADGELRLLYLGEARRAYVRATERHASLGRLLDAAEQELLRAAKEASK